MPDRLDQEFDSTPDFMEQMGVGEKKSKVFKEDRPENYGLSIEMDWIIHYANLITILMFFFMILYAFSSLKGTAYEKAMASIQKQMGGSDDQLKKIQKQERETEMASAMENFIKDKNLDKFANVETNAQRVKISLANPILFDLGSSDLKEEALPALKEIASLIRDTQNLVVVDGHTDNVPVSGRKFRSNFELSAARAFSVIKYFIDSEKIDPARFSAFGYGEHKPISPNDSEENRGKNRRIEINIIRA